MRTVLIIDDQSAVRDALSLLLSLHEIRPLTATMPEEGLALLARERVDAVIADMNFSADTTSGEEGVALFHAIRARHPDLPVILLTGWSHLETAVQLVKAGAADYMSKPWDDAKLLATVENLLELSENARVAANTRVTRRRRREALERDYDLRGIVFASDEMLRVLELACRVARAEVPVLVTGANGAGKERIAEIVHANSAVRDKPLVTVNCGALPSELIEAELFGAEAGAFTGAARAREGRFEAANGGTLFLDDLFYRLNTIEIALPPLSDRPDYILPLAECFLDDDAVLSDQARDALLDYPWPGNVRELKNTIDRAKLLCGRDEITVAHLGLSAVLAAPARNLDDPPREAVEEALRKAGGVISRAARTLGLSRQALYRRVQRYGIPTEN